MELASNWHEDSCNDCQLLTPTHTSLRDKASRAFNKGICTDNASYPLDLHVIAYCLNTVHRLCKHTELYNRRKGLSAKKRGGGV